jgi:hypothetical protein
LPQFDTAQIKLVFAETGRSLQHSDAILIAREIAAYDGLANALAALAHDANHVLHGLLLSYQAALAEQAEPQLRIRRLLLEADDLDARAEPLWAEGASFAGRAAGRELQGEDELSGLFKRKADAAERMATGLQSQAFEKRREAAGLDAALGCRETLNEALRTIAA